MAPFLETPLGSFPGTSQQFSRHRLLGHCLCRTLARLERLVPHLTSPARAQRLGLDGVSSDRACACSAGAAVVFVTGIAVVTVVFVTGGS
jgi:hypothetical protein